GGIYNEYASPTLRNLIIRNNTASHGGGGLYNLNSSPIVINSLIRNNNAGHGGAMINQNVASQPVFINTTIVSNNKGIRNNSNANATFINSIIYDNSSYNVLDNSSVSQYKNSFVQGITTNDANGNIDGNIDPMFINAASGDYRLSVISPLVNVGNNSFYEGDMLDLEGNPRFFGTIDIGAYENQEVYLGPSIIYVKSNATGNNDGSNWANAYTDLQEAIDNSLLGDTIWVAEGIYQPAVNQYFSMKEGVEIYGGFPSDNNCACKDDRNWNQHEIILLGNGYSVIRNVFTSSSQMTNSSVLDGFTITGGNVQTPISGGGIYNEYASPTLRNLIIRNNTASHAGGGLYNLNSSPIVINSLIRNNNAGHGGAMINQNVASQPVFINTTIVSNNKGIRNNSNASATFINSIVFGNVSYNIMNLYTSQFYSSLDQGSSTNDANGNIDGSIDPLFAYAASLHCRLSVISPLVNVGNNSFNEGDMLDLEGNSRFFGTIDIGAYENQ